jgi:hypothetical protein
VLDEFNICKISPRLADFNSFLELERWRGEVDIVRLLSSQGDEKVLRVQLETDHFSGIALAYFHADWRNYQQFRFELFNPDKTVLMLTIRIHENKHYGSGNSAYHDRFNRQLHIELGWNSISIDLHHIGEAPASRAIDLAKIQEIGLFSIDQASRVSSKPHTGIKSGPISRKKPLSSPKIAIVALHLAAYQVNPLRL